MRYGSVCSGIEAATMGWHHIGWEPAFFSEIEEFPRQVLTHHYPDTPCHGDFTTIKDDDYGSIDLLVGGTPCQSFSVAGLRGGMDDERGNLALEFIRLAQRKRPQWVVWENVPGVLSSNGGRDFGSFLGALAEIGYGFAYRVLDAQYFGVAQRRRRVFVVGYLGDWRRAAAVLFERESLSGNPAPSREEGEKVAPAVTTDPPFSRTGNERVECEAIVPMTFAGNKQSDVAATLETTCHDYSRADGFNTVAKGMAVRRLTPTECCRLQQFPDDYLDLKYANADEAHSAQILHTLWREVGAKGVAPEEAHFKENGKNDLCEKRRVASALFTPQILLAGVYVGWVQWPQAWRSAERQNIANVGEAGWSYGFVRGLREAGAAGCSPYRRESFEQLAKELGVALSQLPLTTPQAGEVLRDSELWQEAQRSWPLRYALATETQTASGKPLTPDGPRYKALGNSMAVPVMRWIGERIQAVGEVADGQ